MIRRRRAARHGELPGEDFVASAEDVVADWAAANGITSQPAGPGALTVTGSFARPVIEELPAAARRPDGHAGRPGRDRAATRPPCTGSTAAGTAGRAARSSAGRVIGPIARHLDATGLLLDMAERETAIAFGYPAPGHSEIA